MAMFSLAVATGGFRIEYIEYLQRQTMVNTAAEALVKSRYAPTAIDYYVDRLEIRNQLKEKLNDRITKGEGFLETQIVCGPRGAGKSTLVAEACHSVPSVVCVHFKGDTMNDFALALMSSLNVRCPPEMVPEVFMKSVLSRVKSNMHRKPVIVIEVDKRFSGAQLENLLLLCKELGDDTQLIIPVVVLSSSRAAFSNISAADLRAEFVEVEDLSEEETRAFLSKVLKNVEGSDDDKEKVIDEAISKIGTRLVHLHALSARKYKTTSDFLFLLLTVRAMYEELYQIAFSSLCSEYQSLKQPEVLQKLINGEWMLRDLAKLLKVNTKEIVERNGSIEPHVLYISPLSYKVCIGAHFLKNAPTWN